VRRHAHLCAGLASVALLWGCGGVKAADLFLLKRTGPPGHPGLTLLVNEEGLLRCNGGRAVRLSDAQLVQARTLQEDLHDAAAARLKLAPEPGSVFAYSVRTESGTVTFSDNSRRQPPVLARLALFALRTSQEVCHLPE
jgi:hypothetical protein